MESITKARLSDNEIHLLAQKHFPGSRLGAIEELTEGMFNSAYLLLGEGAFEKGVVLKAGPVPGTQTLTYEKDIMLAELQVYNMLADKPIPTPEIYASDFSAEIIRSNCFFMERLAGDTWKNLSKKIDGKSRQKLMRELGACNAAVHKVQGGYFGYIKEDKHFRHASWSAAFSQMVADILNDGRQRGDKLPYDEIEKALDRNKGILDKVEAPALVSFDMWAGNVFIKEENGAYGISGVLDFERSFYGDPYADFTSAVMIFDDVEGEEDFILGYEEAGGRPVVCGEEERIRMDLYRLYMSLIMTVETYRYGKAYGALLKKYQRGRIKALLKKV